MSTIVAVRGVLPAHRYAQEELTATLADLVGLAPEQRPLLERLHGNAAVGHRHLALPLEDYRHVTADFGRANDAWLQTAPELAEQALTAALDAAGLIPEDVDLLVTTTVTGVATPSLDARLMARLSLREDLVRLPLFGLGCVAGAAGIARVHDWLRGRPDAVAVLVAVELCSLTLQRDDPSMPNLVASGLFGDGAAAVVVVGDQVAPRVAGGPAGAGPVASAGRQAPPRPGPRILGSRSRFYPDTQRAMGWDVGAGGLRVVLGAEVPHLVHTHVRHDVDTALAGHGLTREDIGWWVAHPGGPKVLEALTAALAVDGQALGVTWRSLAQVGNLSSVSVLHVLADTLRDHPPAPGSHGVLLAMGPGFCLETVLLRAPATTQEAG